MGALADSRFASTIRDRTGALALAALAFVWGLAVAPRGYGEGDASELTLALSLAGVPHPTGYPLYVLTGHFFVRALHGVGISWPMAANAWSSLGAATAAYFLYRLSRSLAADLVPKPLGWRTVCLAAPFLPLFAQPIWSAASGSAEVHSWHVAWVALAACTAWTWVSKESAVAGEPEGGGRRRAFCWGLVVGAGLAHHLTSLAVSVPLTIWIVARAKRVQWQPTKLAFPCAAGAAVPLLAYLWIAIRAAHSAAFQWPLLEPGLEGLWVHATGAAYRGYLGGFNPAESEKRLLISAMPWLAIGAGAVLLEAFSRGRPLVRTFAFATAGVFAMQGAFLFVYRVPDPSALVLPLLALGTAWIPSALARLARLAGPAVAGFAAAAALLAFVPSGVTADIDARAAAERHDRIVRAAWKSIPFDRGLVLWNNDFYARLRAYQILEGSRPGLIVDHPGMLTWPKYRAAFGERHGFDPWDGVTPTTEADLARLPALAEEASGLPAVDFDDALRR